MICEELAIKAPFGAWAVQNGLSKMPYVPPLMPTGGEKRDEAGITRFWACNVIHAVRYLFLPFP